MYPEGAIRDTVLHPCPGCYPGSDIPEGDKAQQPHTLGGPKGNLTEGRCSSILSVAPLEPDLLRRRGFWVQRTKAGPPAPTSQAHWVTRQGPNKLCWSWGEGSGHHTGSAAGFPPAPAETPRTWPGEIRTRPPGTSEFVSVCLGRSGRSLLSRGDWSRLARTFSAWPRIFFICDLKTHL